MFQTEVAEKTETYIMISANISPLLHISIKIKLFVCVFQTVKYLDWFWYKFYVSVLAHFLQVMHVSVYDQVWLPNAFAQMFWNPLSETFKVFGQFLFLPYWHTINFTLHKPINKLFWFRVFHNPLIQLWKHAAVKFNEL